MIPSHRHWFANRYRYHRSLERDTQSVPKRTGKMLFKAEHGRGEHVGVGSVDAIASSRL
jgi:hypothetical protein